MSSTETEQAGRLVGIGHLELQLDQPTARQEAEDTQAYAVLLLELVGGDG